MPDGQVNAGLWELPAVTVFHAADQPPDALPADADVPRLARSRWVEDLGLDVSSPVPAGTVRHAITHHRITVHVFEGTLASEPRAREAMAWFDEEALGRIALTSAGKRSLQLLQRRTR